MNQVFRYSPVSLALYLSTLASSCIAVCQANELKTGQIVPDGVEVVEVRGQQQQAEQALRLSLQRIAGGTNLLDLDDQHYRQATLQDALGFTPGVMMQSFFGGNDQPRLNIRGSGIQSNPVNRGVLLQKDGLAFNQADGSFVIGLLDAKQMKQAVVYRGANGIGVGSSSLGGALNFITRNQGDDDSLRLEAGADGRLGAALGTSLGDEELGLRLGLSHDSYDGYRRHSDSRRDLLNGRLDWQLNDHWHNETSVFAADNYFAIPFVVPKKRAIDDPKAVLGDGSSPMDRLLNVYNRDPHRDSRLVRLDNRLDYHKDGLDQQIGMYWQNLDDTFTDPLSHAITDSKDWGLSYRLALQDVFNSPGRLEFSSYLSDSQMQRDYHSNNPASGEPLALIAQTELDASSRVANLGYFRPLVGHLSLTMQVQWDQQRRDVAVAGNYEKDARQRYSSVNPSFGLIYQGSDQRFYASFSASSEAPTFWELVSASVSPANPAQARLVTRQLDKQTGKTLEIGADGSAQAWNWQLSAYRSEIDDELISLVSADAVNGQTLNYAGETYHQGLELGLTHHWQFSNFAIHNQWVYQYSDFRFEDGQYQGKRLAGIPRHLLQYRLQLELADVSITPSLRWQPGDTPVDHMNTQFQDDYLLAGLDIAWQWQAGLRLYLNVENLTDRQYQSSYVIRGMSAPGQPTFLPGIGRNATLGVHYQW